MGLSFLQQVLVCSTLLCLAMVIPKMLGRGGSQGPGSTSAVPSRPPQPPPTAGSGKGLWNSDIADQPSETTQKMGKAMEQEIKSKRTEASSRGLTLTLMPLYAIGVGVFAAYRFVKIKSEKENASKKEKDAETVKTKQTESQLMELEQHLAQTELMLNSLLSQLDPLSNCVNALAMNQREEIMTQLQSIRRLMKENDIDKSSDNLTVENSTCNSKLEDLIQSFGRQQKKDLEEAEGGGADNGGEDCSDASHYREDGADEKNCEGSSSGRLLDSEGQEMEETVILDNECEKQTRLRRRSRKK